MYYKTREERLWEGFSYRLRLGITQILPTISGLSIGFLVMYGDGGKSIGLSTVSKRKPIIACSRR